MTDQKAIKRFRQRRNTRLKKRGIRLDGWNENDHPRGKDGKFTSGAGGGSDNKNESSKKSETKEAAPKVRGNTPKFQKVSSGKGFKEQFSGLRNGMKADKRWRVSDDYSPKDYDSMDKYVNDNGSTFALHGTDIVSVAANAEKGDRGRDVLADAVAAGGNKLDAYSGIYGFYQKCGFEPVSWTEWDDDYANDDWLEANGFTREQWSSMKKKPSDDELMVKREPIVFFKYTGKIGNTSLEDFMRSVEPREYEDAKDERDRAL